MKNRTTRILPLSVALAALSITSTASAQCASPNSTGQIAWGHFYFGPRPAGSARFTVYDGPPGQPVILVGAATMQPPNPIGAGWICINQADPTFGRSPVGVFRANGTCGWNSMSVQAFDFFGQAWFRDVDANGNLTSNTSDLFAVQG